MTVKEKNSATPNIPEQYKSYKELFRDDKTATVLLQYKPWDHEIKLQEGKTLTFRPIYGLLERELKVLRKYINKNLKKGFIQRLESPARHPILFILKKDSSN